MDQLGSIYPALWSVVSFNVFVDNFEEFSRSISHWCEEKRLIRGYRHTLQNVPNARCQVPPK